MFKKILIANRGEIAVRIIRACKEWGISTVAVHSDVDRDSMHVRLADESVCIGSHQPANSYLNIPALMSAIELTNSEAVHPGYGFLSENANFAKVLEENNIKFIGASSKLIEMMGDKIQAKKIAKENGLPIIEGSDGGIKDISKAKELCKKIGYPVLIKASGGGGGKGMKIVHKEDEFESLFSTAKSEAKKYFGNDEVYIEKFFQNPRHIEVQILAGKNRTVHLHERDCSVQRRHQKLIEETPSPILNDEIRKDLFDKTVNMVEKIGYEGAGTVEFIYEDGKFYFLEMNTRVQVEHPVTEMVTGIDRIERNQAYYGRILLDEMECIGLANPNFQPCQSLQNLDAATRVKWKGFDMVKDNPMVVQTVVKGVTETTEVSFAKLSSFRDYYIQTLKDKVEFHLPSDSMMTVFGEFQKLWLDWLC